MAIQDADREHVIEALQRSRAAGHIDQATLTHRTQLATSTQDAVELYGLLDDLPDLTSATWTPSPQQQLMPFEPAANLAANFEPNPAPPTRPAWQQFLANNWQAIAITLLIAGFFIAISAGSTSATSMWWIVFVAIFASQRRKKSQPPRRISYPQSPPPPPPRVQDSFASDQDPPDPDGTWRQPPR